MNEPRRRPKSAAPVLCAVLALLWVTVLSVAGPVHAQTNSPAQGGSSNESGTNVGGDGQAGNRTTPGGAGATGGGSSGAGETDTGGGGNAGAIIGVIAILAVIGLGVGVATRHRRVMEDTGASGR